ncbi:MAG: glutamate racemase [Tepidisphaerales bacterium]
MNTTGPVAVVDSGLGGLTVLRQIMVKLPGVPLVYFGDTARLPYGNKSPAVVTSFLLQIVRFLRDLGPSELVIACNTATALTLPAVRAAFPDLPVLGVIDPGARAVAEVVARVARAGSADGPRDPAGPRVGLLATEATVRSRAYEKALRRWLPEAQVEAVAAPLLVPVIEEGRDEDDPVAAMVVRDYLQPLVAARVDAVLLGCTHYPIYRRRFERTLEELGWPVPVVDSAEQCAAELASRRSTCIEAGGCSATRRERLTCYVTDDPGRFQKLAWRFLGMAIDAPTWVPPERLPEPAAERPAVRRAG